MQLNYFSYNLKRKHKQKPPRIAVDLRKFVRNFVGFDDRKFKKQFLSRSGDHLYLLPTVSLHQYLFVATRDQEIVKMIDSNTLKVEDIRTKLEGGSVGFASYIYFGDRFFALASTLRGPRVSSFSSLVNQVIQAVGGGKYKFEVHAIESIASKEQVLKMEHVGAITFEVDPKNAAVGQLLSTIGMGSEPVQGLQVTIKPQRKASLKDGLPELFNHVDPSEAEKFKIRARAAIDEDLADFYLTNQGELKDTIAKGTEKEILQSISQRVHNHETLHSKLDEQRKAKHYVENPVEFVDRFSSAGPWAKLLDSDPVD